MSSRNTLDLTFAALADPTRRALLARLAYGEATVSELAQPFSMTQPAISRHLKILEEAGLVSTHRHAQSRPRRLELKPLEEVETWIEQHKEIWTANYERLDALLSDLQSGPGNRKKKENRV